MHEIKIKRAYDEKAWGDGHRVLVDRLWPRGVSKKEAALDEWPKNITPSDELRKSVHNGEIDWNDFEKTYESELRENEAFPNWKNHILNVLKHRHVTLITAAKLHNQSHVYILKRNLQK